jgi:hypothetical protein
VGHTIPTKAQGGMEIMNIDIQNQFLLSKWLYKLINEQGTCQDLLRKKYMQDNAIGQIQRKPSDSQFWVGLMNVEELFLGYGSFQLNSRTIIRFWDNIWVRNRSLKEQYPQLYRIVRHKNDIVATVFRTIPLNISFRRSLTEDTLQSWHELVTNIAYVRLNDEDDKFRWGLNQNGISKVCSMYNAMIVGNIWDNRILWKLKLLLKIKKLFVVFKQGSDTYKG